MLKQKKGIPGAMRARIAGLKNSTNNVRLDRGVPTRARINKNSLPDLSYGLRKMTQPNYSLAFNLHNIYFHGCA